MALLGEILLDLAQAELFSEAPHDAELALEKDSAICVLHASNPMTKWQLAPLAAWVSTHVGL